MNKKDDTKTTDTSVSKTSGKVQTEKTVKTSEKKVKMVSAKKLPPLFKKEYTVKKYEKKIGRHIFIESDRKFIDKFFENSKNAKGEATVKVNLDSNIPSSDLERCKTLAKQIKSQKGGIKIVPLAAVIVLVAGIGISFTLFKNVIIKNALVSSMQGFFKAKTDIQKVDFKFFDSSLKISGLQQANKDSPMKNIFQLDEILVDFNLADLCRGKFHAENLVVEGVALDTERTKSGELPLKAKKEKKKSEEAKLSAKSDELKQNAMKNLMAMFENYNPEKMIEELQDRLTSPKIAAEVSANVQQKIAKWQAVPEKLSGQVAEFSSSVNAVANTDWSKVKDPVKLKSALETLNGAYTTGTSLKATVDRTSSEIKTDAAEVSTYAKKVESAVKSDLGLVEGKISEIKKLFSPDGLKQIMDEAVQSMLYSVLGKYYPYVDTAMKKALEIKDATEKSGAKNVDKNSKKTKASKKQKKEAQKRLSGRDVYFKADGVPKFLVNKAVASGYEYGKDAVLENLLFKGVASDISSNPDIYGKPAKIEADFKILGKPNNASIVIDARSKSQNPLIDASYSGKGYPVAADAQVFSFNSNSDIQAKLTADADGNFKIGGNIDMFMDGINGMEFEPARLSALYRTALLGVKNLTLGFTVSYDSQNGTSVSIDNLDKISGQIVNPITAAISTELNSIANESKAKVSAMLSEKTGIANEKITQFTEIQRLVNNQKNKLDSTQKQLEAKRRELENQIKNAAASAASSAITDAAGGFFKK